MYQKILIPLDGSPFAEQVIPHVTRCVTPHKTQLILLGVMDSARYATSIYEYMPVQALNDMRAEYVSYLETIRKQLQNEGYDIIAKLVDGEPAEQVLHYAESYHADLIAMTTHGRSGLKRIALGSVAERVVHGAKLPVMLVRGEVFLEKGKLRRILVPLDGSQLAEEALPPATTLAQETGAEIVLFHAITLFDVESTLAQQASEMARRQTEQRVFQLAETYLASIVDRLAKAGVHGSPRTSFGDVTTKLSDLVDKEEIDLVVMSTHGRSGLSRWMYGSVANQVMRTVNCPVLMIRNLTEPPAAESVRPILVNEPVIKMAQPMPA